jgi:hypothetical protein
MKAFAIVLVVGCGATALAQAPAPAKPVPGVPDPDQLFQFAPGLDGNPQFKMEIPDGKHALPLPRFAIVKPPVQPGIDIDPGMILKPHGFVEQPSHPAPSSKLYPDLKVLPIEIARLDPALSQWPNLKAEPIPRTWPRSKVEPIPTTWEGYRVIPIKASKQPQR